MSDQEGPGREGVSGVRSSAGRPALRLLALAILILWAAPAPAPARAQEPEIRREGPKALETFENDADHDGAPDGWYNLRDAKLAPGGVVGAGRCLRFEADKPSRPARASLGFGVDGRSAEAIVIGMWVRLAGVGPGEREGEEPGLQAIFYDEELVPNGIGRLGPWGEIDGAGWVRVARRLPVPRSTRDVIITVGLLGATGTLEVDGLTIDLVPAGGAETTDLIRNGGFELADPEVSGWVLEKGARRVHPGRGSDSALELKRADALANSVLAMPVDRAGALEVTMSVRAAGLRGGGAARLALFFFDDDGQPVEGLPGGAVVAKVWGGSFGWRREQARVDVPPGAVRAVLHVEKEDPSGSLLIDDVRVEAANRGAGTWRPDHEADDTTGWKPHEAAAAIEPGGALDASALLDAPAGRRGRVVVRDGHLAFADGGRARFFGVSLLPLTAYQDPDRLDALADRLARSGVNLVRLSDLDMPLGPAQCLFDDARDDTRGLDPLALARLDHLVAALKSRGIYVALELLGQRRFRRGDGLGALGALPPGGGAAAAFDPDIRARVLEGAEALLRHVNPETGLPLGEDPALAWVTLSGEHSLFDLHDGPDALTPEAANALRALANRSPYGSSRNPKFWQVTESAQWQGMAEALRKAGLKAPVAGCSHWRREADFVATQHAPGLDLIDDRIFWMPVPLGDPSRRSFLWDADGAPAAEAARKRKADRPYVVGQWWDATGNGWALPFEGAELLLVSLSARAEDWDAVVRRGVFSYPAAWGANATGTAGGPDRYVLAEAINGNPQVFGLLPHAASLYLRGPATAVKSSRPRPGRGRSRAPSVAGWDPARGRLEINTPHTQGIAGWTAGGPAACDDLTFEVEATSDSPYAVVVATALGPEPIALARRLLVTAVARVQPTDFRWVDSNRFEVASPGRPPLLREPVRARVTWRRKGKVAAFALDDAGARVGPVALEEDKEGHHLVIDGKAAGLHWELVVE